MPKLGRGLFRKKTKGQFGRERLFGYRLSRKGTKGLFSREGEAGEEATEAGGDFRIAQVPRGAFVGAFQLAVEVESAFLYGLAHLPISVTEGDAGGHQMVHLFEQKACSYSGRDIRPVVTVMPGMA